MLEASMKPLVRKTYSIGRVTLFKLKKVQKSYEKSHDYIAL